MIKIEIDVPPGTTKLDIGPILQPILSRLIRLERESGYHDINEDETYFLRNVNILDRPVTNDHIIKYFDWIKNKINFNDRLLNLTYSDITTFLIKNGWRKNREAYSGDTEEWEIRFMKQPGYGGSQTPFETCIRCAVLTPKPTHTESIFLSNRLSIINTVIKLNSEQYRKITAEQVLNEIEKCVHPLIKLAASG